MNKSKRNVGVQTVVQSKEYMQPSIAIQHDLEAVEYPKIFALPHSLFALMLTCLVVFIVAISSNGTSEDTTKKGILGAIFVFLSFGTIYLPDSLLRRPHPIFWRFLLSCAILYLLFITFVLFKTRDQAREFLAFFDDRLGKPLAERSYGDKCDLSSDVWPYFNLDNLVDALDVYLLAHLIGWYLKMLIVRDFKFCWFCSIFFEVLELTFRHWLPNFHECWWDHMILDVFGCNALGIWLGDLTIRYYEMKDYKWVREEHKTDTIKRSEKLKSSIFLRYFKYFTPNYYIKQEWGAFSSLKRFWQVIWFIIIMNLVDLGNFFLKYILWLPPSHWLLFIRINIWGFLSVIAAREFYQYISDKNCRRLYSNIFIAHLIIFVEFACVYKFSDDLFITPFPKPIIIFWTGVFIFIATTSIHLFFKDMRKKSEVKRIDLTDPEVTVEEVVSK